MAVHCLMPLLGSWAASWAGLTLTLDEHGAPPGLQAFMRGCTALASVAVRVEVDAKSADKQTRLADVRAVQSALAATPAMQMLRAFPSDRPCSRCPWSDWRLVQLSGGSCQVGTRSAAEFLLERAAAAMPVGTCYRPRTLPACAASRAPLGPSAAQPAAIDSGDFVGK